MATWTNETKNFVINTQPIVFNQLGILFNQLGVLFGGNNGPTIWTDEIKS